MDKQLRTIEHSPIQSLSMAFSQDVQVLVSLLSNQTAKLWDVLEGTELQTPWGHSRTISVAFPRDSQILASG